MALPPGPRVPATVATAQFARRPLDTLLRWHRSYGDVFTVKFLVFEQAMTRVTAALEETTP